MKNHLTRTNRSSGSAEGFASGASTDTEPIVSPDTIPEPRDAPRAESDAWFSDVFFEDEGVVAADLPAESELNVSGRQFIEANISSTDYPNNPQRESTSDVSVDQQLQVKVRGSVADDLLEVQIDFDDSLPEVEQQQTKIFYNGRERDFGLGTFQAEGQFGDIKLSLPGSKFVSYNKSTFGLSGQIHLTDLALGSWGPERLSLYGVASEEKGETQKKTFTGNNQRRVPDPVPDINPIRRTYYQPLGDVIRSNRSLPIQPNSETVYLDDQNAEDNDANTIEDKLVENGSDTYRGDFEVLDEGEDYAINYRTGVIRLKSRLANDDVLAVSLTKNDGSQLQDFMIKDPDESNKFDVYHLRNRYQLASRNIVRDDPDRVLEIRDPTDSTQPSDNANKSYAQLLGLDRDNDGVIDDEFIDFELGVLRFPDTTPFVDTNLAKTNADTNPTVYGPPSQRQQFYEIYQEILVEENTYSLGVNVVRASEEVTVDGQTLERGADYTIDYQSGFLTFFDHIEIDEETNIEVNYEQQGVGNQRNETFLGGRMEAVFSDNLELGSTILNSSESQRSRVPQVGGTSKSTTVSEFDVRWNPLRTFQDALNLVDDGWGKYPLDDDLTIDLKYDWAESTRDPAQEGLALIDNFSRLDQRVVFSKSEFDWSPADPVQQFPGPQSVLNNRSGFELEEVENVGHDPDPEEDESQESMRVKFDMGSSSDPDTWGSIQQLFSTNSEDLRGYQYLEFWVKWEGNAGNGTLSVDLGQTTENTNRGGLLTEDENDNQILNPGEDDGYFTNDFRFGENNGQLDSEDLDRNGRLDEDEGYIHFPSVNRADTVVSDTTSNGWSLFKIPIQAQYGEERGNATRFGDTSPGVPEREEILRNAGMVRLVYQAPDDSGKERSFLLEQMGAVETRWEPVRDNDAFSIDVKTSDEDPRLPAPNTSDLRDENDDSPKKGMSFVFDEVDSSDSGFTRASVDFPGGQEIRQFKSMNLFFNTKNYESTAMDGNDTGIVRFGSDANNYFQYNFPLTKPKSDPNVEKVGFGGNWYKLSIDLTEFEQDLIDRTLSNGGSKTFERGNRRIVGSPSLLSVKQYVIGFVGPPGPPHVASGELLFDGFHLSDPRKESGEAKQLKADVDVRDGLIDLQATDREVDGEFRTIGLVNNSVANDFVAQNEISRSLNGSIDLNRFIPSNWSLKVPLTFNWSDETTRIPPDRIERVRNDNLGEVTTIDYRINSGLNTPSQFPSFSFAWSKTDKDVTQERRDKEWSELLDRWNVRGDYGISFEDTIGGFLPIGNDLGITVNGNYSRLTDRRRSFGEVNVDTETRDEVSRELTTRLDHEPVTWLESKTQFKFSDLHRSTQQSEGLVKRDQSVNYSLDLSRYLGFQPRFSFGTGIREDYDRDDGVSKAVDVNGNSSLRVNTNPERWWSALDFLSLNYSYSVNSSARYTNLDAGRANQDVYRNFYEGFGWLLNGPDIEITSDSLTLARTRANKNVSHRLGGQLRFWRPLDSRYDLNFSQNFGQTDNSVNRTNVLSVSLSNRLRLRPVSSFFKTSTQNASLSLDYNFSRSSSREEVSRTHSPDFQISTRWNRRWSTTFNLAASLTRETDRAVDVRDRQVRPSMNFKWLVNESKSSEGTVWFDNRLEINGEVSGQASKRTRNGETREDNWEASFNAGSAYNITERIKSRFGANYSIFRDQFRESNDRNTYGFDISMDFRF